MTTLPRCRSRYEILGRPAAHVVAIIDTDDGLTSVTNDAENVVAQLVMLGVLRPGDHLIYRDSMGLWDEIALTDPPLKFKGFLPLRTITVQQAVHKMIAG